MPTRWGRWCAIVAAAGLASVLAAVAVDRAGGVQDREVSVTHRPPSSAVAGDPLVLEAEVITACSVGAICSAVTLTAHYRDGSGEPRQVSAAGRVGRRQTILLTIPQDVVRAPSFSYRLEASYTERPAGVVEYDCEVPRPPCRTVAASTPEAGDYGVDVDVVIRMRFAYPDGRPAAGVLVIAAPHDAGTLWQADTDTDGLVSITLPRNDPWVEQRRERGDVVNIFVSVFDGWPTGGSQRVDQGPVAGHGTDVGVVVNFGDPLLGAVDRITQDQSFTLTPQERVFQQRAG